MTLKNIKAPANFKVSRTLALAKINKAKRPMFLNTYQKGNKNGKTNFIWRRS